VRVVNGKSLIPNYQLLGWKTGLMTGSHTIRRECYSSLQGHQTCKGYLEAPASFYCRSLV